MESPENLEEILQRLVTYGILNAEQARFFEELFRKVRQDKEEETQFSSTKAFLSESRKSGIINIGLLEHLESIIEEVNAPRVEITSPPENERTVFINQLTSNSIQFIAEIKNLEMRRRMGLMRGYKYRFSKITGEGFMEKESILAKGRTEQNTVAIDIAINDKNFGIGVHRIQFTLLDVFSKKEVRQKGLWSRDLISECVEITIEEFAEPIRRAYDNMGQLTTHIESLQQELNSLRTRLSMLLVEFPKSESELSNTKEMLEKNIMQMLDLKSISMAFPSYNDEEIMLHMPRYIELKTANLTTEDAVKIYPVLIEIKNQLPSGASFFEIAADIMYTITTNINAFDSKITEFERKYSRRKFLTNVGLGTAIVGGSTGVGVGIYNLVKEEDLAKELKKITVKIIKPQENSVVGIGDYIRDFEAVAEGPNKKLVQKINDGEIGKFEWVTIQANKEDRISSYIHVGRLRSKSEIPIKDVGFDANLGRLMVTLYLKMSNGKFYEVSGIQIVINFIKIVLGYEIKGYILYAAFKITDNSGKNMEYEVTPLLRTEKTGEIGSWPKESVEPNKDIKYTLRLGKRGGENYPPGDYNLWIEVKPKDSNQAPVHSKIIPIKIEEEAKITYSVRIEKIETINKKKEPKLKSNKALRVSYAIKGVKINEYKDYGITFFLTPTATRGSGEDTYNLVKTLTAENNDIQDDLNIDKISSGNYTLSVFINPFGTNLPTKSDSTKNFWLKK